MPHIVFAFDVLLKANGFVVECRTIQAANEAGVLEDELLLLLLTSQIGKSIDDDTEN